MKPIIDIHSHILPKLDDGCPSRKQAQAMLKIYEEQGAEAVICTPHFGVCGYREADTEGTFEWLCTVESSVKLYLGNEILCDHDILLDVREGRARRLAGTDRILIEFDEDDDPKFINDEIKRLCDSEFRPVLAHAERYRLLRKRPELYHRIVESGARIQINAYSVCEDTNRGTVQAARYLLENRLVSFIGSDAHGESNRPPRLVKGVRWIYDHCPEDYADAVVHDNAAEMIAAGTAEG